MDEQTKGRIFEPFFTTKQVGHGTGMGLAAVYGTVQRHNGTIVVESQIGEGTSIAIYLPQLTSEPDDKTDSEKTDLSQGSARVLIVDDEKIVRDVVTAMLQELGYEVVSARDGREAVETYEHLWQQIDVVLLDMVMPSLNGRETFIAMRNINPAIKAVLCTGYDLNPEAQAILDEGVLGVVHKPYQQTELSEVMAQVLGTEAIPNAEKLPDYKQ
jgi:CheY-like chemotaxis protein